MPYSLMCFNPIGSYHIHTTYHDVKLHCQEKKKSFLLYFVRGVVDTSLFYTSKMERERKRDR